MGATLTPISPTLRHRPQKSTCRSVARNNQFPCEGNEIVGKGGGRGGERNEGGRQNWCSRQSVVSGFFSVSRAGFFVGIFGSEKKLRGTLLLDPLSQTRSTDFARGRSLVPRCLHWQRLHGVIYLLQTSTSLSSSLLDSVVSPLHLYCRSLLPCSMTIPHSTQVTSC